MFAPTRLSEWALFVTIFQAAAIVNVGGGFAVGVAPFFFVATLVALRVLPEWWNGGVRFVRGEPGLRHVHVLTLFVGWTVFSAFVSPVLFAGTPVDSPRMGVDQGFWSQMPLRWSFSNAGQAAYMLLNFIMLLHMLQMSDRPEYIKRLQWTFSFSGMCVVAIGAFQVLCPHLGVRFPSWLFNSNTAWDRVTINGSMVYRGYPPRLSNPRMPRPFVGLGIVRVDDRNLGHREQRLALDLRRRWYRSSCGDCVDHRLHAVVTA